MNEITENYPVLQSANLVGETTLSAPDNEADPEFVNQEILFETANVVLVYVVHPQKKRKYLVERNARLEIVSMGSSVDSQTWLILKSGTFSYPLFRSLEIRRPTKGFYCFPLSKDSFYGIHLPK